MMRPINTTAAVAVLAAMAVSASADEWPALRVEAARAHDNRTAAYLLGLPLLADFLEEGLSMLGRSCEEFA